MNRKMYQLPKFYQKEKSSEEVGASYYGMPKLEKEVKDLLEEAYQKLRFASDLMDVIDTIEAGKIAKVRKEVLAFLQGELNI